MPFPSQYRPHRACHIQAMPFYWNVRLAAVVAHADVTLAPVTDSELATDGVELGKDAAALAARLVHCDIVCDRVVPFIHASKLCAVDLASHPRSGGVRPLRAKSLTLFHEIAGVLYR